MKRHLTLHALLAGALLLPAVAQNDAPSAPPPPPEAAQGENPPPPQWGRDEHGERGGRGPRRGRPRFDKDDPRFQENFRRWRELPPEQQQEMRRRFDGRQRMREEIDKTLSEAGITLTEEQKEAFIQRYREERRKVEDELRVKMDELRKQQMEALRKKLLEELKTKPAS